MRALTPLHSLPSEPRGVVLVTHDPEVLRWVQGCAAVSGVPVDVVDARTAVGLGASYPLLLLGADAVDEMAAAAPQRHPQLHLVGDDRIGSAALRQAVHLGVRSVLDPRTGSRTLTSLLDAVLDPRPPGRVIGVASGSGGAGGTTLGAALVLTAARSQSAAWVVTPQGVPDPTLFLGSEPTPGLDWAGLERAGGAVSPASLRETLPVHRRVALLAGDAAGEGDRPSRGTVRDTVEVARSAYETVVVDLDLADVALARELVPRCDALWVVVRAGALGLAAAEARLRPVTPYAWSAGSGVVVRGDGVADHVVTATLGLPVAHRMGHERRLDEWLDLGAGVVPRRRGPLARAAQALLTSEVLR